MNTENSAKQFGLLKEGLTLDGIGYTKQGEPCEGRTREGMRTPEAVLRGGRQQGRGQTGFF